MTRQTNSVTTRALCGAILLLGGCGLTPQSEAVRDLAASSGAQAYDEGLANAEWFVCQAASVGSVQRRYGAAPDLAAAWRSLCLGAGEPVFAEETP
jgi:hypothetical protein